ncbi:MAG: phosphatidylserine/phosphatidylglycerophosphate/cardiolipin synthase family protein [Erythrobacter sp.]|nr:phosphatidylserine/phosphatidylglycerophosphate/cardiolipin synthase family protein [Erythrobacter sp.]
MESSQSSPSFSYPDPFYADTQGHKFCFMPDGVHRFDALLEMIQEAKQSLHMFYYMFQDDLAGNPVRDALVAAAGRGVEISLIVDRFGSDASEEFFQPLIDAGARFCFFNAKVSRRYLVRNHQKMTIADRHTALLGGFNISEHYFNPPAENGWCDIGVKVEGPLVDDLLDWFALLEDWAQNDRAQLRAVRQMVAHWEPGDGPVRLLVGGPTRSPNNWSRTVKRDLAKGSRLDLIMAYFSPPRAFRRHIRRLARRGHARLVMAAKSDNSATVAAARATYRALLHAGADIYEFQPCKLHMKLLVIDDAVYFGSANFDHRSIRLNLELMVRVEDSALADRVREFINKLSEASLPISPELHRGRHGFFRRIAGWIGWFLVTTVDYTVSRRLNIGG